MKKALFALVPLTLIAFASCGGGEDHSSSSSSPAALDPSAASGVAKTCRATCNTAADCGASGQPLQDASHFACQAGRCEWLGCRAASECQSALQSQNVTCTTEPGAEIASCVLTCNAPADCVIPGSALTDQSHFACNAGKCTWLGCQSTTECQSALHSSRYACDKAPGDTVSSCLPTCQTPADCQVPGSKLNDPSHYACRAGRCQWLGCRTTAECAADLHTSAVVCE